MWCVYKHTNKHDGKSYIGRCRYPNVNKRWHNGKGYIGCSRFLDAIKKNGWDSFNHEILFCNLSFDESVRLEKEMIAKYKTNDPDHGYNVSIGGIAFFKGLHHTADTKRRISENLKRYEMTESHHKHLSESKKGAKHHLAKRVYQFTKDGTLVKEWDYMQKASEELGINKANISSCCLGNRKTAGGYIWTYERV